MNSTQINPENHTMPIKIPASFFFVEQADPKMYIEVQRTYDSQNNCEKNKSERLLDMNAYYKASVFKTV